MGSDFEPYWCRTGDMYSAEEGFAYGVPVPIVELPVAWYLDDFPFFEPVMMAGLSLHGLTPPADVLAIWQAELDYLVREVRDGILVLAPSAGHRPRTPALDAADVPGDRD